MLNDNWKIWAKGIGYGLESGNVSVPHVLLTHYSKLQLSEAEVMLLLQLLAFRQIEQCLFPSIDQLESRMSTVQGEVPALIQRLMKDGWLSIDEDLDELTGKQTEEYNLSGMYEKLAQLIVEQHPAYKRNSDSPPGAQHEYNVDSTYPPTGISLFNVFEKEFARPLTPMECETISGWLDEDRYPDELILLALKESVFAGKVHFRYIDRILLEWSRNRVKTVEDAKAYIQKFRNGLR